MIIIIIITNHTDHQNNNQVVVLPEGENPRGIEKRLVRTVLWLTIMIMVVIMMVVVVMVVMVVVVVTVMMMTMVMIECSRCVQWFGDQWAWIEGNPWRRETRTGSWTWTGHGEDFFVVGDVDCDVFDDRNDADDYEPLEEGDTHRIMDMDKLCFFGPDSLLLFWDWNRTRLTFLVGRVASFRPCCF